jgi:glycosyltransferase involved in cell wall biosynthesis
VPAVQPLPEHDAAVSLPIPGYLTLSLGDFVPDVVHVHHPFFLGDTGLRLAAVHNLPVVFTHHTMYEQYTHYLPTPLPSIERFTIRLVTEFANHCDHVVAPSESVAAVLRERGVTSPITAIPTGIDREKFASGDGARARVRYGLPADAFVVGHVGRLAPEKNLEFLVAAVCQFLTRHRSAHFLLVGDGPLAEELTRSCSQGGLRERFHHPDHALSGEDLYDAYAAMNVYAFTSQSETQGMVLAEAMAAGVPVVAVDAPGARDILRDRRNGRLVAPDDQSAFVKALEWIASLDARQRRELDEEVAATAAEFSMERTVRRLVDVYEQARRSLRPDSNGDTLWNVVRRRVWKELEIWSGVAAALGEVVSEPVVS